MFMLMNYITSSIASKRHTIGILRALGAKGKITMLYNEDMHAHNTFDAPDAVTPVTYDFDSAKPFILPKAGIAAIEVEVE